MERKISKKELDKFAFEIIDFLKQKDMARSTRVYWNGRCYDGDNDSFIENIDPKDYFEFVGPYLSMSFEGDLYDVINYAYESGYEILEQKFSAIFDKYGFYYELGDAWNLSAYEK